MSSFVIALVFVALVLAALFAPINPIPANLSAKADLILRWFVLAVQSGGATQ